MPDAPTPITWQLFFDGLCEPRNPGGAMAWAWYTLTPAGEIWPGAGYQDVDPANTNNVSEWYALGFGLADVKTLVDGGCKFDHLIIRGDSKLVINQLTATWGCHSPHLVACRARCMDILRSIRPGNQWWTAEWIPREQNDVADAYSREEYTRRTGLNAPERGKGVGK